MVKSAGVDQMRLAFKAAKAKQIAYVGAGAPETSTMSNDWRHLLDLVEPIDQPDSADVEQALRDFAISATDAQGLDNRVPARTQYRGLLAAGDGWLPPLFVRRQMDSWTFVGAGKAMAAATAVLTLRNQVKAAADALGLTPDGSLRTAYEGAQDGFTVATAIGTDELAALTAIADAKARVEPAPDFVTQLGLGGQDPRASYEAARTAFEAGQLDEATSSATAATALLAGAPAIGQQRLIIIGVGALGGVLILLLLFVLIRRRRRGATTLAFAPAAVTLADPSEASPQPSASPPDDAGGPAL